MDAGELVNLDKTNVALVDDLAGVIHDIDVLIDFSLPESTAKLTTLCCQRRQYGHWDNRLNDEQNAILEQASEKIAIVYAGNYSTGVNLTLKLLEMAAKAFGDSADVEVIEAHHKHKIDAPSGTAYMMAEAVAKGRVVKTKRRGDLWPRRSNWARKAGEYWYPCHSRWRNRW